MIHLAASIDHEIQGEFEEIQSFQIRTYYPSQKDKYENWVHVPNFWQKIGKALIRKIETEQVD